MVDKMLKIIQVNSCIGHLPKHKATLIGLGLRHIGDVVERHDTPEIRGMINLISYMVKVKKIQGQGVK